MVTGFFDDQTDKSAVKADIVVSYFGAWAAIMAPQAGRIAYVDLFAGPGRYGSGEKSTPLLILEKAVSTSSLTDKLSTTFNDANREYVNRLRQEIAAIPGVERLRFQPVVRHGVVGDDQLALVDELANVPLLAFLDPWGYKGLSSQLILRLIQGFGCDAIFFFNYDRINRDITNGLVEHHMRALFGDGRLKMLQDTLPHLAPREREDVISRTLAEVFEDMRVPHLIPFKFRRGAGRISHYICFVSKSPVGHSIMKDIMAKRGIVDADGVPKFEYFPGGLQQQLSLFEERPIQLLARDLKLTFAGRSLPVKRLFEEHHVGTPFILSNYKKVLKELEQAGAVECNPSAANRKPRTLANHVLVTFPPA